MQFSRAVHRVQRRLAAICLVACSAGASRVDAQTSDETIASNHAAAPTAAEVLAKPVSVSVDRVPIDRAIRALAAAAGVTVSYKYDVVVAAVPNVVTLHVRKMPLADAFARLLEGTSLQLVTVYGGQLVVTSAHTGTLTGGIIIGTVTSARTQSPLRGANVMLDDTVMQVRTDAEGHYRFANVAAGSHRVTVRAVGFVRKLQSITVTDDSTATLNVALDPSTVNTLDQVVVTATGAQRVRELGHVVATINADSLVKEAPITSVSELLQSRIPGLQVISSNGGIAGGPVALRLRGQTSISLNSEPVIVIDGVRYRSNSYVQQNGMAQPDVQGGGLPPSPINDLNVNDIESVDVVKGPSASTLYGPEASNGVIVITTKHAKSAKTTWSWYAHPVLNTVPVQQRLPQKGYQVWGHDSDGQPVDWCSLLNEAAHVCTIDSITTATTFLAQPQTSIIGKNRPEWQYGLNLSGGSGTTRYYVSGGYDRQEGALQVPPLFQKALEQQLGTTGLSDDIKNPNSMKKASIHTNVSMQPWSRMDLDATVDYGQSTQHRMNPTNFFLLRAGGQQVLSPYTGATDSAIALGLLQNLLSYQTTLTTDVADMSTFNGNLHSVVHLVDWATLDALVGATHGTTDNNLLLALPQNGHAQNDQRTNNGRTGTLGLTTTAAPGRLTFRTALGPQYLYQKDDGLTTQGFGLAPGSNSIATAGRITLQQVWSETVTLGTYAQETMGLANQLFLSAGLRLDGSTRFGDKYSPTPLPKVDASWIASEQPWLKDRAPWVTELRFRGAYGQATRYPTSGMKLGNLTANPVIVGGQNIPGYFVTNLANPVLSPERSKEFEYGADLTLFSRVHTELTWWRRRTNDELKYLQGSSGSLPVWRNVASVSQHGTELSIAVPLTNTRQLQSDIQFTYAFNTSKILSLGDDVPAGGYVGLAKGYPLDAIFGVRTIGVADTAGGGPNGIAEANEVISEPATHFLGVYNPPKTYTLTPTASMFGGRIRLSAVFDRETGFVINDEASMRCGAAHTCLAPYDINTPLIDQARASFYNSYDFLVPGNFTRWREMNITFDIPLREWLHLSALHLDALSRASVSLQGRNLALWTPFKGTDPESRYGTSLFTANTSGIPQPRGWALRFDITP